MTTQQRARNPRLFLYSACAIALQTIIALVGVELVLRILDLRYLRLENGSNTLPYQHDPEIGWVPIANWVGPFTGLRTTTVRQNSLGLRDIEHEGGPRPTIMVVGDSFVWGYDVEAKERFTDLLRRPFSQYRIVNAGVAEYGTDQEYLLLQRLWSKLTPQVVVLIFSQSNDRADNSGNLANDDYFKPYIAQTPHGDWQFRGQPVPHPRYTYFRENWFVRNSLLGRLAVSAYVHLRQPRVRVPDPTEHLMGMMRDLVEARGSKFLVGLQVAEPQLETFLQAEKIPYVTLDGAVQYRDDGSHWTPSGHVVVAERVGMLLTKAGIRPDDDYDYTIENHDEVVRIYPREAMAFVSRGSAYAARGQFERAILDYDEAIRLDPGNVVALHMRGLAHRDSGRLDRAIADLDEAARLSPANAALFQQSRPELAR